MLRLSRVFKILGGSGEMNQQRRTLLQVSALIGLMASTGLITKAQASAWQQNAFGAKSVQEALEALGAGGLSQKSDLVVLRAPDVAENGAMVAVGVETQLKATEIAILIEKNMNPLAARFVLPQGTEPFLATRVKMAQSSNVYALIKADGQWLMTFKEVKVTVGGCGV
jgi:sulfur-oxidizing protein SoxY